MSATLDAVRAELHAAVAEVSDAYTGLPPGARAAVEVRRDGLDRELDAAFAAGDAARARAAVEAWRRWWAAVIERAADG